MRFFGVTINFLSYAARSHRQDPSDKGSFKGYGMSHRWRQALRMQFESRMGSQDRFFLHAWKLAFPHPRDGRIMTLGPSCLRNLRAL